MPDTSAPRGPHRPTKTVAPPRFCQSAFWGRSAPLGSAVVAELGRLLELFAAAGTLRSGRLHRHAAFGAELDASIHRRAAAAARRLGHQRGTASRTELAGRLGSALRAGAG